MWHRKLTIDLVEALDFRPEFSRKSIVRESISIHAQMLVIRGSIQSTTHTFIEFRSNDET
jgi:hypothetical protein